MNNSQDVLLLCSKEDHEHGVRIGKILAKKSLSSLVLDCNDLPNSAGKNIETIFESSKCIAFILTENTGWDQAIKNVVLEHLNKGKLLLVKIGNPTMPEELQYTQTADLTEDCEYEICKFLTSVKDASKINFQIEPCERIKLQPLPYVAKNGHAYQWYGAATTGVWLQSEQYRQQKEAEEKEHEKWEQESIARKDLQTEASIQLQAQRLPERPWPGLQGTEARPLEPALNPDTVRPKVFISYSHKDVSFVEELERLFKIFRCPIWRDVNLYPGENWSSKIKGEVNFSSYILVIWSKSSIASNWVLLEAQEAYKRGRLLGLRIDDCIVPEPYSQAETFDFVGRSLSVNDPSSRELLKRIGELTYSDLLANFDAHEDGVVGIALV